MQQLILAQAAGLPSAGTLVLHAALLTAFGLLFFRGITGSDMIFSGWKRYLHIDIPESVYEAWKAARPLPFRHPAVLASTGVFVLPAWSAPLIGGSAFHELTVLLSVGLFLSPFGIPSMAAPELGDLRYPPRFAAKWAAATLEVSLKALVLSGVFALLTLIPFAGRAVEWLAAGIFPVVGGRPGSPWVAGLLEGAVLAMFLMVGLRLIAASTWGHRFALPYIVGTGGSWIMLQWFVNEVFIPLGSKGFLAGLPVLVSLPLAALREVMGAALGALGPGEPRAARGAPAPPTSP